MTKALKIKIVGIVQGVGFRPFVYRLAKARALKGYVKNLGGSEVEIHIEGREDFLEDFVKALEIEKPEKAKYDKIIVEETNPKDFEGFEILKSSEDFELRSVIPPDFSICEDCIKEIEDPRSRFYRYPWNSCINCGPRFSMLEKLPYDRENTSMQKFELCEECRKNYMDPKNFRRFHAQGISCPKCGPKTYVYRIDGRVIEVDDPIHFTAKNIIDGKIFAIKGVGGYHIACSAKLDEVVAELRRRKGRGEKPFALMVRDLNVAEKIAFIDSLAKKILISPEKPIVILPRRNDSQVSKLVAPGLSSVGIMLPYTGFQHLLLKEIPEGFLIMTSANLHGKPICTKIEEVFTELSAVVDYVVEHDREIVHGIDDSVVRFTDCKPVFLRRSRGYAPNWIEVPSKLPDCLALGAELQTAGAVAFSDKIILTQYIGDLDDFKTLEKLKKELKWLVRVYKMKPKFIALDMHPNYHNRAIVNELNFECGIIEVQHHHAHAASAMADAGLKDEEVVAITIDGTGYGDDGTIWGGEVLIANYSSYKRVASLKPFSLPGGDSAAKYPVKSLIALMASYGFEKDEVFEVLKRNRILDGLSYGTEEFEITFELAKKNAGTTTTSLGRTLDAFASLLGICKLRTYEGEPPMRLEAVAEEGEDRRIELEISKRGSRYLIDLEPLLNFVVDNTGVISKEDLAKTVLLSLGRAFGEIASFFDLRTLVCGGAAVNTYIFRGIKEKLGRELIIPKKIPPNDGGIAVGQIMAAAAKIGSF